MFLPQLQSIFKNREFKPRNKNAKPTTPLELSRQQYLEIVNQSTNSFYGFLVSLFAPKRQSAVNFKSQEIINAKTEDAFYKAVFQTANNNFSAESSLAKKIFDFVGRKLNVVKQSSPNSYFFIRPYAGKTISFEKDESYYNRIADRLRLPSNQRFNKVDATQPLRKRIPTASPL